MNASPNPIRQIFQTEPAAGVAGFLQKLLAVDRLIAMYARAVKRDQISIFDSVLASLDITPVITDEDLARIPRSGPVIAIANHPFGLVEGAILGSVLAKARPDFRIMVNSLLDPVPEFQKHFIFVDPFGGAGSTHANLRGMKESLGFLKRDQGLLAIFPAGEVAHVQLRRGEITDPPWHPNVTRLIQRTGATVLPMFFDGVNSALFHLAGMIHPLLRTALLPHELLNKQGQRLELRIGSPISPARVRQHESEEDLTAYLRKRTFLLRHRESAAKPKARVFSFPARNLFRAANTSISDAADPSILEAEIAKLEPLVASGEYTAYIAEAHQIPSVLGEICRLREITFRAAGEGTGKALDTDSFDAHYQHLFLWRRDKRYVVGAYRLGETSQILERFGAKGLYTNTLFAYRGDFLERLGPALELGRSFVRVEEQRNYAPLLTLWKGIGAYVAAHPQVKMLFGPVSISNDYQRASRQLIVSFFRSLRDPRGFNQMVRGRNPFGIRPAREFEDFGNITAWNLDELSECVAELEHDRKGVPVLLRQYMKLGGKLLAFNVDSKFTNALDGLILVDLTETDPRVLVRYLGKEGAKAFVALHGRMQVAV